MAIASPLPALHPLTSEALSRIHAATLKVLETEGLCCESDLVLRTFRTAGASIGPDGRTVRLNRDMIEWALQSAPHAFVLHGRGERAGLPLRVGAVYFGMGGTSEPLFWDRGLGGPRPATKADMIACTRVGEALENIDFLMALCSAGDVPPETIHLHEYDALLRNSTKPIVYTAPGQRYAEFYVEMAAAAAGGEAALRERPSVALFIQPVSPLTMGTYSDGAIAAVRAGVPVLCSPGPMMGATSPASLAGTLAQINAEALFAIVFVQLLKKGAPVIYGPHTGVMDMRTAQCTYGSPEQTLARAAVAQMASYYDLPSFGMGGGVEAKRPDAEAAAEAMMGMLTNALSGLTLTQTLGTMGSGMYGCLEMLAICDEMVRMVRRITAGIDVSEETLALDAIRRVGAGGHYLTDDHTLNVFRRELYRPGLFARESIEEWQDHGSPSVDERAYAAVSKILASAGPVPLPPGADTALEQTLRRGTAALRR